MIFSASCLLETILFMYVSRWFHPAPLITPFKVTLNCFKKNSRAAYTFSNPAALALLL
jgi:hypothetical protein